MDDTNRGELQIYSVEEREDAAAICIVRCVGGIVRAGQKFHTETPGDTTRDSPSINLDWINRHERMMDFIDPPHSAKVHLSGQGVSALKRGVILYSIPAE
ncbi:hypothetical protein Sipo8835_33635 [Streptomyces ipomoeae]|uniref:Uncharacterized protein n=1 Tax=Streptomyces ipomoeae TaxID=103232 RepID=A0AAE8VWQ2_9ACTN|nr:hypothetical protein Sipo8835_33635 [Streptomyces ipomoeae]